MHSFRLDNGVEALRFGGAFSLSFISSASLSKLQRHKRDDEMDAVTLLENVAAELQVRERRWMRKKVDGRAVDC